MRVKCNCFFLIAQPNRVNSIPVSDCDRMAHALGMSVCDYILFPNIPRLCSETQRGADTGSILRHPRCAADAEALSKDNSVILLPSETPSYITYVSD